jgi:hypothetical protein
VILRFLAIAAGDYRRFCAATPCFETGIEMHFIPV